MPDDVFVLDPKDAGRIWLLDLIHSPRALPPLSADLMEKTTEATPIGLDAQTIHGYSYRSPRGMGPGAPAPQLAPGEALRRWQERVQPACEAVYLKFRDQDYASMTSEEILALLELELPRQLECWFATIQVFEEFTPDAERLSNLLEAKLGAESVLLSAAILHGSGSQTRSLGDDVAELAVAARQTPSVESALFERDFGAAAASGAQPWASTLSAFLDDHADEVALWSEVHVAPWNVDPIPLMRLVAATLAAPGQARSNGGSAAIDQVRSRLAPEDVAEFEAALALGRDYVPVIEHRARWQLKLVGGLRRAYVALGEDLVRRGLAESADDIFLLHVSELEDAVAGNLDIPALVARRREQWQENQKLSAPMTLGLPITYEMIGMMSPLLRRVFGAVAINPATATVVSGIAANGGVVRGRARIVGGLAEAEDLLAGDVLVCPSTSPPWTPYFAVVSAVVTDGGGVLSHAAIEAREYGIPAVVGTREGTRLIPEGAMVTVDGSAGTVTIEA